MTDDVKIRQMQTFPVIQYDLDLLIRIEIDSLHMNILQSRGDRSWNTNNDNRSETMSRQLQT